MTREISPSLKSIRTVADCSAPVINHPLALRSAAAAISRAARSPASRQYFFQAFLASISPGHRASAYHSGHPCDAAHATHVASSPVCRGRGPYRSHGVRCVLARRKTRPSLSRGAKYTCWIVHRSSRMIASIVRPNGLRTNSEHTSSSVIEYTRPPGGIAGGTDRPGRPAWPSVVTPSKGLGRRPPPRRCRRAAARERRVTP